MSKDAKKSLHPNPARSIHVDGALTHTVLDPLVQAARSLLNQSREPITIYIKSGGGSVEAMEKFANELRAKVEKGKPCPIITVAKGETRSVAAYLLVLGDFAYAKSGTMLNFHGMRYGLRRIKDVNREDALVMAMRLDGENRKMARKLADKVAPRVAAQYLNLMAKPARVAQRGKKPSPALFNRFIELTCARLSAEKFQALVWGAREEVESMQMIARSMETTGQARLHRREAALEARIFNAVIADKLRKHDSKEWLIDEIEGAGMLMDYLFIRDALTGPADAGESFGQRTLWYYAFALCRRLLVGENAISAQDAYTLGLLDEVIGPDSAGAQS